MRGCRIKNIYRFRFRALLPICFGDQTGGYGNILMRGKELSVLYSPRMLSLAEECDGNADS